MCDILIWFQWSVHDSSLPILLVRVLIIFFNHLNYFLWIHYCNVMLINGLNVPQCHCMQFRNISKVMCHGRTARDTVTSNPDCSVDPQLLSDNRPSPTDPLHPHCKFRQVPPLEAPSCFKILSVWWGGGVCAPLAGQDRPETNEVCGAEHSCSRCATATTVHTLTYAHFS